MTFNAKGLLFDPRWPAACERVARSFGATPGVGILSECFKKILEAKRIAKRLLQIRLTVLRHENTAGTSSSAIRNVAFSSRISMNKASPPRKTKIPRNRAAPTRSRRWDIAPLQKLLSNVLLKQNSLENCVVEHEFPRIGRKKMRLNGRELEHETGHVSIVH